ncbi:MAG: flagellar biosynthesis protein FlhF [Piscinibacter sp.]|uniref:flagellar biosynthesis protein FlhF n=1 Tax=Piscinibacter sp. TaxID=1903157 RepID=UPI003D14C5DE
MKVKRYFASNMRSALDMIKQEQGPDVLILSNRKVDGGVELITADQLTEQEAEELARRNTPRKRPDVAVEAAEPAPEPARPVAPPRAPSPLFADLGEQAEYLWTDAATMAQMREELRSLKGLLETQLSGLAWSEFGNRHPLRARLLRVLSQVGLAAALARQLVAEVPDELDYRAGWHRALALLVMRLKVWDGGLLERGGRVALLGPTGVGKSTLASKLAARYALTHGPEQVSIVSMDDRRLGAHQQMKAFGRLIGSSVYTLRNVDELADVLDDEADRGRLVVIDTPGHAPGDSRYNDLVLGLEGLLADIRMIKVLSATTDYASAAAMFRRTTGLPLDACVLTKLDEAASLGPSLSAVIEAGLPLAWTCAGQRVPDDLDEVAPRALVERMVELAKSSPVPDDQARIERAFSA